MGEKRLRWGILGTANIARKNWKAIWNSGNGIITAVASRETERSREFIDACQAEAPFDPIPRALGDYDALLQDPEVDAVYIPLPTGIRGLWAKKAAEHGKHMVCEKPAAITVEELLEIQETCRQNGVQYMDGVMFVHSRRLGRMRECLQDGNSVGRVRRISSAFSFAGDEEFFQTNIRGRGELEPHGCLGDLGWYNLYFSLWAMNWEMPKAVTGRVLSEFQHRESKVAVPSEFSGELLFEGGVSSSFYCSFLTENEQWAMVSGTRGHLWVPDFVLPFAGSQIRFETGAASFLVKGCEFKMEEQNKVYTVDECSHGSPEAQESLLFRRFGEAVLSGKLSSTWPEMALKAERVMEACWESSRAKGAVVDIRQG